MKKNIISLCLCLTTIIIPVRSAKGQISDNPQKTDSEIVLSGLQMNVTNNVSENKEQILAGLKKASAEGSSFLVTPEGSLSGYMNSFDQKEVAFALKEIETAAKQLRTGLLLGTCYKEIVDGKEVCYNEVRVYTPEGNYIGEYSKILRCSNMEMPGTGEMTEYAEGKLKIFEWNGLKFGILICNDLWATPGYTTSPNPYLVWKLKQMGAQFIVHCINSGIVQKYRPFHESSAELWAQSMTLPILEVNAAQGNEKINAQSGLIDNNGLRSIRVPDSGVQFFTARISIPFYPAQKLPVPADKKATKETVFLFQSLYNLKNKGIMFGHQDDLMYGYTWWHEKDRSDTKEITGDYPAVAGFELGHIELGSDRSLDSVSFSQIAEQIKVHYKRGGVVTLSWHLNNPVTVQIKDANGWPHGSAWDVSSKEVVASILPGGKNNELFNTWLDRLATFFISLKDDKGVPIPFIFRPFHEHSGSFFWWGTNICTDQEYSALWRYTVGFLRDKKNIHNILYAYNTDRVTSLEQYMKGYPGDDIIDMLSIDMYDRGEQFGGELDYALGFVTKEAVSRNKLTALSETGERKGLNNWWTAVLLPSVNKYPVGYVLTWRDAFNTKVTVSGSPFQSYHEDFKKFYDSPHTLFLKDITEANIYKRKQLLK